MTRARLILPLLLLALLSGCGVNEFFASHGTNGLRSDQKMSLNAALQKVRSLERRRDWKGAEGVYRSALNQHGGNKKLKRRYLNFKARRQDYLARMEVNRLIRQANALKRKHYRRKAKDPSYNGEHWREAIQISKRLADKGLKAMQAGRSNLAERALEMSVRVHSNRTTRSAQQRFMEFKERQEFAELVRKGRKMADISSER
ncbi:MAG: hypothetical protein H7842_07460 [Gammaproteobacteria bacterium SHHR-1]|uniref:hypothetical protein n=1 Tax=Magnetovirga frankeli TaxID=947516 RepID=UPI0012935614|nr:hypothetical protein D5125_06695 [gamma proteobacterium SS-5]